MAILKSCCFWKTVRKGSFASAFYTLIYFGVSSLIMLIYVHDEQEFLAGAREQPAGESILAHGDITPAVVIFNILFLGCSLLLVVSSLLVIVALRHDRRELLLPWIIFMLCDVLIELSHLVYLSITQMVNFDPIVGFIFTVDFFIMCLNSYCLLCVISQYQDYRQGRGYGAAQMRAEVVAHVPKAAAAGSLAYSKSAKLKQSAESPFYTTNPHSRVSTIPEEMDQNHKLSFSAAEVVSDRNENMPTAGSFPQAHDMQKRSEIPIVTFNSN